MRPMGTGQALPRPTLRRGPLGPRSLFGVFCLRRDSWLAASSSTPCSRRASRPPRSAKGEVVVALQTFWKSVRPKGLFDPVKPSGTSPPAGETSKGTSPGTRFVPERRGWLASRLGDRVARKRGLKTRRRGAVDSARFGRQRLGVGVGRISRILCTVQGLLEPRSGESCGDSRRELR